MKYFFITLSLGFLVAFGGYFFFIKSSQVIKPTIKSEAAIEPEFDSEAVIQQGSRMPASAGDEEVTRAVAEEEVNTLVAGDSGVDKYKLNDTTFLNKYGEFEVEVIADPHSEDAPSIMKFYIKCKDNRRVKSGTPPAREWIRDANVNGQSTCHFNDVKFIPHEIYGDVVTVSYNIDKTVELKRKNQALRGRDFCDQGMKMDFNFPELCSKWNPE